MYVGLLVPVDDPFNCHRYTGVVPPLTGVAVNVTGEPAHTEVLSEIIFTVGVTLAETRIVIILLDTVVGLIQRAFEVIITFTWSLCPRDVVVNTALFAPVLVPLICH